MNFNSPYNREEYVKFFRDQFLPEDFLQSSENISPGFSAQYTRQIRKIGRSNSLDLTVYEIRHASENDPRVSLSKESFRLLAEYGQSRALVLFISDTLSNYRLSLVTIDLKWEEGKRVQKEYSNPRRLSFFLGPDSKVHTPQQYLLKPGRIKDFDDLKKRFSIEVVNKDFFTEIAILFSKLTGGERKVRSRRYDFGEGILDFPSIDKNVRKEFVVRLIGRLVFCWFLKKKRSKQDVTLLPEELLSSEALNKNKGYYHNVLAPLFFEVLNTPMDDRNKRFTQEPWPTIPFLNGGLFTPHDDDYYPNHEQQRAQFRNMLSVPDDWLRDLLNVFESYNFTIDENTPVDVELAIEPEMLGRIFENLLAEINPETGDTARKATGSYYTPRPIVEYMVDESLKQYLLTKTGLPEAKISPLLSYGDENTDLTETQKDSVLDALDTIKIIDPACGSGAFPMGILQKILLILRKLDPDSKKWLGRILSRIDDAIFKKDLERKLKRESLEYVHKLGIIRDAIYGVDIQPIAVEISKLRCFLSLIVDQTIDDTQPNRGVEPLPNLEFKFVCANTLIGLGGDMLPTNEALRKIDELKQVREEYLNSYGKDKKDLENKFLTVRSELSRLALNWQKGSEKALKLADWNPFSDEPCSWFDPEWMFGIKDGFDIAIANPPYVEHKKLKYISSILKANFTVYAGSADLYVYFYEKALELLRNAGVLTFISSNKFIKTSYGENLRDLLSANAIQRIIDFTKVHVFSALVASCVVIVGKRRPITVVPITFVDDSLTDFAKLPDFVETHCLDIKAESLGKDIWQLEDDRKLKLKSKIEDSSNRISEFDTINICRGVTTGCNEAFVIDEPTRSQLIKQSSKNRAIIKSLLQGRNIKKWRYESDSQYLIFTRRGIDIGAYPSIEEYLSQFREQLEPRKDLNPEAPEEKNEQRKGRKPGPYNWYEIQDNTTYYSEFEKDKIIWGLTADKWAFAFDDKRHYLPSNGYILTSEKIPLKYLLGLLNSKLMQFYFGFIGIMTAGGAYTLKHETISELPIKNISPQEQQPFIKRVDRILAIARSDDYETNKSKHTEVKELEQHIDQMVYGLYGLTPDEIAIVEGHSKSD